MGVDYYACAVCERVASQYDFPGTDFAVGDGPMQKYCNSCLKEATKDMLPDRDGMYLFGLEYHIPAPAGQFASSSSSVSKQFVMLTLPTNLIPALADRMCWNLLRGFVVFYHDGMNRDERARLESRKPPSSMDALLLEAHVSSQDGSLSHDFYNYKRFNTPGSLLRACSTAMDLEEDRFFLPDPRRDARLRPDFPTKERFFQFDNEVSQCFARVGIPGELKALVILYTREQYVDLKAVDVAAAPSVTKRRKLETQMVELRARHKAEIEALQSEIDSAVDEEKHVRRHVAQFGQFVENEQKKFTDQFVNDYWNKAIADASKRTTMLPGPIVNMNTPNVETSDSDSPEEEPDSDDDDDPLPPESPVVGAKRKRPN